MATCRQCGSTEDLQAKFCVRCGAQMPEDSGRWWAEGGTTGSPETPPAFDRPAGPAAGFADPTMVPMYSTDHASGDSTGRSTGHPTSTGRSKRTRRIAFGAVGALLIVGVAGVAYRTLSGSSAGAGSPESAVGELMSAVADENPVDLVNTLAPSELRSVSSLVGDVTDASQNKGEAAEEARLNGISIDPDDLVPGFDLTIDELTYVTDELAPGRVAKVTVRSLRGSWSFDPAVLLAAVDVDKLTDGEMSNEEMLDELDRETGSFDEDDLTYRFYDDESDREIAIEPFLMTVHEGDGWFVSPTYTVLEYIRVINGIDTEPDFREPTSSGAADPAAAIERTIEAYAEATIALDIGTFIDSLPPSRYGALYAYREPLRDLVAPDDGESDFVDGQLTVEATVTLDQTSTFDDSRGDGLTVERGRIEIEITTTHDDGSTDQGEVTFDIDGACATMTASSSYSWVDANGEVVEPEGDTREGEPEKLCLDRLGSNGYDGPFANGIPGIDTFWLVLQHESGGWYVDPLATFGSWFDAVDDQSFVDEIKRYIDDQQRLDDGY